MSRVVSRFVTRLALMIFMAVAASADLLETSEIDWSSHISLPVYTAKFTLYVCRDHFPAGSAARQEIETAASWYNKIAGAAVRIEMGETGDQSIADLYPRITWWNSLDYVDNIKEGFPCHEAGDTANWTTNTCKYAGTGWNTADKAVFFTIAVNAAAVEHDTNPSATDYPKAADIAHSLGHAFGMIHSEDWPESDRGLISTMQYGLEGLSAYDRAFMRHIYRSRSGTATDFAASPVIRKPSSSVSGFSNSSWERVNPDQLYLGDDSYYYDCATHAYPVFQATWFNTSTVVGNSTVHQFLIGPKGAESGLVTVYSWISADMPAGSQDSKTVTASLTKAALESLAFNTSYRLTFRTDRFDLVPETSELAGDNGEAKDIILRPNRIACQGAGHRRSPSL